MNNKTDLNDRYNPSEFEEKIYKLWESSGAFKVRIDKSKKNYVIPMPPPNVTGILHMGHGLQDTIQDLYIRYKRMKGFNVFWIPGKDHAGIATQNVVEKMLEKQGIKKEDLGRDDFVKKVWEVVEKHKDHISKQKIKIGDSCDWSKEKFTLDKDLSRAVTHAFVELYNRGFIFKGKYIVNWCPRCETALSDEEVDKITENSFLWEIRYPLTDGDGSITVSTTRPETMLGDTAVAVNPQDLRYKHLVGKKVNLPLTNRVIPIIADSYVDTDFGSGAVKITPAHDPNDFDVARRHNLPSIVVIDSKGKMTPQVPQPYRGLDRDTCRERVINDLKEGGYLVKTTEYTHNVGKCSRCNTTIEPSLSDQWFVDLKSISSRAREVVENGTIKIYPKRWEKIYFEWLDNIREWCISRQLWWGHRIPVYYCKNCGKQIVSESEVKRCPDCNSDNIEQDPDVLDTWFSSWLWPFSTLGWPLNTEELEQFYPADLLVSGYDILFFWIIKMVIAGTTFTGKPPFYDIYLTPLIRDKFGRKMAKSLNNGIDPIEIINKYGADALRFTLVYLSTDGQDISLDPLKFEMGRNFANKLFNAFKFCYPYLKETIEPIRYDECDLYDRWILSKLQTTVRNLDQYYDNYKLQFIASSIYNFIWHDFCDWYIESCKPFFFNSDKETANQAYVRKANILTYIMDYILKILHPLMPFITEELYQHMKSNNGNLLTIQKYPGVEEKYISDIDEKKFSFIENLIVSMRTIKAELNLHSRKDLEFFYLTKNSDEKNIIEKEKDSIKFLASIKEIKFIAKEPDSRFSSSVISDTILYLVIEDLVDKEKEIERLKKEIVKLEATKEKLSIKLNSEDFKSKAKKEIIEKTEKEYSEIEKTVEILKDKINKLT